MNIAFVGVKRDYQQLDPSYVSSFDRFHLELPWYFAVYGRNNVTITTTNYSTNWEKVKSDEFDFEGALCHLQENLFHLTTKNYDVVVHWRKWFPEFYVPTAVNVIVCQDHSFSDEWKLAVGMATHEGKLHGVLCFPEWHERNLVTEMVGFGPVQTLPGMTLGVDPGVYRPSKDKDPYTLLWASDPGRGLRGTLELAAKMWSHDKRYRLRVLYPDYVKGFSPIVHPAIKWEACVPAGERLFSIFNEAGWLPYTSTFKEPSSRAHRQAMAAGALVLYPPGMGTPSDLLVNGMTGIVSDPNSWTRTILDLAGTKKYDNIVGQARDYAVTESWEVQARRFNKYFEGVIRK